MLWDETHFNQNLLLCQDREKYFITPHCDVGSKFVTSLFYMPDARNAPALRDSGTLLLRPVPKPKRAKATTLLTYDSRAEYLEHGSATYKVTRCEFRPNHLVAFAPCVGAWHAVPLQKFSSNVTRDTIQSFVGYPATKLPLGKCASAGKVQMGKAS